MRNIPQEGEMYRHFKGNLYELLYIAKKLLPFKNQQKIKKVLTVLNINSNGIITVKELLKPFKQKREKFTHISDVWKNKLDYEMITEYIEDNKVLMDAIEKQMIKEGVWPLGDGLWN